MNKSKSKQLYKSNVVLKPMPKKAQEGEQYLKDEKYAEEKIIQKYLKKGFTSLTVEELAVTLISPTFNETFLAKAGEPWSEENKSKAIERLNFAKFNIQWNTSVNKKSAAGMMNSFHGVLFDFCQRGDIQKVSEYFKKNANRMDEIIHTVDNNKKSLLHIAAKSGHTQLVTTLINKGFSVLFRDRFLRTPLHLACQFGRDTCADELLKKGSEIYARDSIGRTCLHYAACSDSARLVTLLLGNEPELVNSRDTYGRTPLHYVVWNGTDAQLEIAKKLLDAKSEVDALDEDGMSPLHFAADAGKGKVIPLLLKYGANPFLRDGRTHRTSLELALTERIREIIIVYSGDEYKPQLNEAKVVGTKINLEDAKRVDQEVGLASNGFNNSNNINGGNASNTNRARNKSGGKNKPKDNIEEEEDDTDKEIKNLFQKSNKNKLFTFLKNIQHFGIHSMEHLKRPELFSGSWVENLKNTEDLFTYLSSLAPQEAVLSVFNVLYPTAEVEKFKETGEEKSFDKFFSKTMNPMQMQMNYMNTMGMNMPGFNPFNTGGNFNNTFNNNQKEEENPNKEEEEEQKNILQEQIDELKKKIAENKSSEELRTELEMYKKEVTNLTKENAVLKNSNQLLTQENESLKRDKIKLEAERDSQKDQVITLLKEELRNMRGEMQNLKDTIP